MHRFLNMMLLLTMACCAVAEEKILNIYAWTGEIPETVVQKFEKETDIKVNIATYENNEVLYAKLNVTPRPQYDLVMPSSYLVDRLRQQDMLEKLDKSRLPLLQNLDPEFLNPSYDPHLNYSIPYLWGVTGIFFNRSLTYSRSLKSWADLWNPRFYNQLLLLDDVREVFSMALLSLGYSANDDNPEHIRAAFLKLKALMKNVKFFSSEMVVSAIIDEDATVGMAWNGDAFKAFQENTNIRFVYPREGFVIWVDNFAIPKQAPHKAAAYQFLNFMLREDIAKEAALYAPFPTANKAARAVLPASLRYNLMAYPTSRILKRGQFQTDLSPNRLKLFEKYWEQLKIA